MIKRQHILGPKFWGENMVPTYPTIPPTPSNHLPWVWCVCVFVCVRHSVMSSFLQSHGLLPARLLCPWTSPGNLPNPGIRPRFPALQADSLLCEPPGNPTWVWYPMQIEKTIPACNGVPSCAQWSICFHFQFVEYFPFLTSAGSGLGEASEVWLRLG